MFLLRRKNGARDGFSESRKTKHGPDHGYGRRDPLLSRARKPTRWPSLKKHCTELLKIQNDESGTVFYDAQAASLEAKPYPTLDAIQNVFALALKRDPEIKNFNPLVLWTFTICGRSMTAVISTGSTGEWRLEPTSSKEGEITPASAKSRHENRLPNTFRSSVINFCGGYDMEAVYLSLFPSHAIAEPTQIHNPQLESFSPLVEL